MEPERHEYRDEWQQVEILPQRWDAFRNRNQPGMKSDRVSEDERRQAQKRVGRHVEGDEDAVEPPQHYRRGSAPCRSSPSMRSEISCTKRSRLKRSACARIAAESHEVCVARAIASANAGADPSSTRMPVVPGTTVSTAPPRPRATTGVPHACASTGTMPKSSSPGSSVTAAPR